METMTPKNPESQNCQYVLTLSPEQALVVEQACELYARLNIGQFETITEKLLDDYSASDYGRRRDAANSLFRAAAEVIFGRDPHGQLNVSKGAQHKRAWAVYTTLRHRRAWHDNPEGAKTWSVCYDDPMPYGIEPMPKCEVREVQHERA